jgi:hypothetical protein
MVTKTVESTFSWYREVKNMKTLNFYWLYTRMYVGLCRNSLSFLQQAKPPSNNLVFTASNLSHHCISEPICSTNTLLLPTPTAWIELKTTLKSVVYWLCQQDTKFLHWIEGVWLGSSSSLPLESREVLSPFWFDRNSGKIKGTSSSTAGAMPTEQQAVGWRHLHKAWFSCSIRRRSKRWRLFAR